MTEVIPVVIGIAVLLIGLVIWSAPRVAAAFSEEAFRGAEPTPEQVADIGAKLGDTGEINCL